MNGASSHPSEANPLYSPLLYTVGHSISGFLFNTLWRRTVRGRENIPAPGQTVIFAANHRSLADPNLVGSAIPYPIHYFAKAELFNVPLVGWYIAHVNAFPVRRTDTDVGALKRAQSILEMKEGLLVFPEGGRRLNPEKQFIAKAGVGMLACKTGALICPVGIIGSDHFTRFSSIEVRFGKAFYPPANAGKEDYQRVSDDVMARIQELCQ
jgi:1-acyl-sn-glycerol-3-phosphate acyltransferase